MALTLDQFKELTTKTRNSLGDEGAVSEILVQMADAYGEAVANSEKFSSENETLRKANENLRDSNMRLFLKLGGTDDEAKKQEQKKNEEDGEKFDDIMGRLKGKFI